MPRGSDPDSENLEGTAGSWMMTVPSLILLTPVPVLNLAIGSGRRSDNGVTAGTWAGAQLGEPAESGNFVRR